MNADYKITLSETLRGKTADCLRKAAIRVFEISDSRELARDELADVIGTKLKENPFRALHDEIECLDEIVATVLKKMILVGPQRLSVKNADQKLALEQLKDIFWIDCRDWKEGKKSVSYTLAVPEEIRALFPNEDEFERWRSYGKAIVAFAKSAITLYGVVTFEEVRDIIDKYWEWDIEGVIKGTAEKCGGHSFEIEFLKRVIQGHAPSERDCYLVEGEWICHCEFGSEKKHRGDLIKLFVSERDKHERWYPKDADEFLGFEDDWFFLDMPECEAFEDFLSKHGMPDEQDRVDAIYDMCRHLQIGTGRPAACMKPIVDRIVVSDDEGEEFCALLMAFINRINRRMLNGHTPEMAVSTELADNRLPPVLKVNPHANVGRNDPCPCGSGKRFKHCCGAKAKKRNAINTLARERLDVYLPMRDKTMRFVSRHVAPMNGSKELMAAAVRLGMTKDGKPFAQSNTPAHAAVVGDFAAMMDDEFGPPPIKRLIANASRFTGDSAIALEMYRQYRYTWMEILDVEPGVGVVCRDLMTGKEGFLMETSLSRDYGVRGMTICAGIGVLPNGTWMVLGTVHPANFDNPALILKIVLSYLSLPTDIPVTLSFADQARFAAETIKRINANGRFSSVEYGGVKNS